MLLLTYYKKCRHCGKYLVYTDFWVDYKFEDGRYNKCRKCSAETRVPNHLKKHRPKKTKYGNPVLARLAMIYKKISIESMDRGNRDSFTYYMMLNPYYFQSISRGKENTLENINSVFTEIFKEGSHVVTD